MTARRLVSATALALALLCGWSVVAQRAAEAGGGAGPVGGVIGSLPPLPLPLPTRSPAPPPAPTPAPTTVPSPVGDIPLPTTGPSASPSTTPRLYLSVDGQRYPAASYFVPGSNGRTVYWGEDFDSACYDTPYIRQGIDEIAKIAKIIRKSGRQVVFTVAPNKSAVEKAGLEGVDFPHGSCARRGMRIQDTLLDSYRDPSYIPMREVLTRDRRLIYWDQDTHWTGVGSGVWAKQLAKRLDPQIAHRMRFVKSTLMRHGMLHMPDPYSGPPETEPALLPGHGVKVHVKRGEVDIDDEVPTTFDHSWHSSPRSRTYPGHTLLLGDSFTYLSLADLRPIFAHGRYLWHGLNTPETVAQAIVDSDTVVLEVLQRFVNQSQLANPDLKQALRAALAAAPPTTSPGRPR